MDEVARSHRGCWEKRQTAATRSDPKRDSMVVVVVSMGAYQFCSQNMSKLNVVELFVYLTIFVYT